MRGKREIYSEEKRSRWVVIVVLYCSVVSVNLLSTVCSVDGRRWVDGYPIGVVVEAPD